MNSLVVDILPSKESKVVGTLRVPLYFGLGGNLKVSGIFKNGTRSVPTTLEPRWRGKVVIWDEIRVL